MLARNKIWLKRMPLKPDPWILERGRMGFLATNRSIRIKATRKAAEIPSKAGVLDDWKNTAPSVVPNMKEATEMKNVPMPR